MLHEVWINRFSGHPGSRIAVTHSLCRKCTLRKKMEDVHLGALANAVFFACMGLLLFAASFGIVSRMFPFDIWKEIGENRNVAVATLLAGISIAIALVISSAVH